MPIISEEDYLSHYGRKGMKWYQHIFGDDDESGNKRVKGEIARAKRDIAKASKYSKIKTAGALMTSQILLSGANGMFRKAGYKTALSYIKSQHSTITTYTADLVKGIMVKNTHNYSTLSPSDAIRIAKMGSNIGTAIGLGAAVALPLLGYAAYVYNDKGKKKKKK